MSKELFEVKEENGNVIKLKIRQPNYNEIQESNRVYNSKIASLIRDKTTQKLLLRQEAEKFLEENGIWTEKEKSRIIELQSQINDLLKKMNRGGDKLVNARKSCIDISDKRKEIVDLWRKRQVIDDATIESVAEIEKIDYLIFASTVNENGDRHWESFEDLRNDKGNPIYQQVAPRAYEIFLNIDPNFEKNLPENKWLRKYNFVDENLSLVDRKTGQFVDRDGNVVDLGEKLEEQVNSVYGEIKESEPFKDENGDPVVLETVQTQ